MVSKKQLKKNINPFENMLSTQCKEKGILPISKIQALSCTKEKGHEGLHEVRAEIRKNGELVHEGEIRFQW